MPTTSFTVNFYMPEIGHLASEVNGRAWHYQMLLQNDLLFWTLLLKEERNLIAEKDNLSIWPDIPINTQIKKNAASFPFHLSEFPVYNQREALKSYKIKKEWQVLTLEWEVQEKRKAGGMRSCYSFAIIRLLVKHGRYSWIAHPVRMVSQDWAVMSSHLRQWDRLLLF